MPRPRRPRQSLPRRNGPRPLRAADVPTIPTLRPEPPERRRDPPPAAERESAEEAAVRRMVEAAYT
jgi:hypothetical protein